VISLPATTGGDSGAIEVPRHRARASVLKGLKDYAKETSVLADLQTTDADLHGARSRFSNDVMAGVDPSIPMGWLLIEIGSFGKLVRLTMAGSSPAMTGLERRPSMT
jgi:hypothetical protein